MFHRSRPRDEEYEYEQPEQFEGQKNIETYFVPLLSVANLTWFFNENINDSDSDKSLRYIGRLSFIRHRTWHNSYRDISMGLYL